MATAVKNNPETSVHSLFDRAAAVSLVGVVYVVGCFGIVFKLLPYVFWDVFQIPENNISHLFVAALVVVAATVLLVVGVLLLGNRAPHGARAGIFVGILGVVLILLLTRWASLWIEYGAYYDNYYSPTIGAALTAGLGVALLLVSGFYFLHPQCERYLILLEDQGWFSVTRFKPLQGVRVRRGTILGMALLVAAGLYTLDSRGSLARLPMNWELNIPFTGKSTVNLMNLFGPTTNDKGPLYEEWNALPRAERTPEREQKMVQEFIQNANPGKAVDGETPAMDVYTFLAKEFREKFGVTGTTFVTDRYALRDFDRELSKYVKVESTGDADNLTEYRVYEKSKVDEIARKLAANDRRVPKTSPIPLIYGTDSFQTILLLPLVQFTVLFLLAALAGWMAWRIVNFPAFADFLIATEAEMNKVSWTSRKNLIKDTIVVLVTVFLMALYLFAMDQAWSHLLSWKPVRILQIQPEKPNAQAEENKPW